MVAANGESFSVDEIAGRLPDDVGLEELPLFADLARRMAEMAENQPAAEGGSGAT